VIEHPSLESHIEDRRLQVLSMDNTRRHITCYDPATAYHLNTVPADTPADIAAKIMRADIAQKQWRHTTLAQRRKVIRSLKKWLVDNQQDCARVACRDTGKTCAYSVIRALPRSRPRASVLDAALGEVLTTAAKADYIINYGEDSIAPESRNKTNIMLSYKRAEVHYEPLGTVAAIVSWNYRESWSAPACSPADVLQPCTTHGRQSWLPFSLATLSS
jgi:acyl-CoA reductase-like NAD-dependent aldehyde dehydrogenase